MLERRDIEGTEVRAESADGKVRKLFGSGVVYNVLSVDLGGFRERFIPGAFADWLKAGVNIRSLFNHDANVILGDTRTGTLRISDGGEALRYELDMPQTQTVQDMVGDPVSRGTIAGNSFQFSVRNADGVKWEKINGEWIRNVSRAEIYEVGPVVFPAYPQTEVAARSLAEFRKAFEASEGVKAEQERIGQIVAKIDAGTALNDDESAEFRKFINKFESLTNNPAGDQQKRRLRLLSLQEA